jgi:hypothetical protein
MALQAGHLFGNYRIVRLLGEGGFGEVYLAENPLIERRAAVKVLHTAWRRMRSWSGVFSTKPGLPAPSVIATSSRSSTLASRPRARPTS